MHELRIAEDLTDIVFETAEREHLSKVTGVNIIFGQMIQIVPAIFEAAFREIVNDTIAQNAVLDIEIVAVKMKCKSCGCEYGLSNNLFACPVCNSTDLEIINGKELFIKSIEGEQIWK